MSGAQAYAAGATLLKALSRVPEPVHRSATNWKAGWRGAPTDALVEAVDIYPTLAELCGVKTGANLAGRSLAPLLHNPASSIKSTALSYWVKGSNEGYSIRDARYRLVRWAPTANPTNTVQLDLFDYQTDPGGTQNAAAQNPQVVAELLSKLN